MAERRTVKVKVFDGEQYAGEWPEGRLVDVIAWFQAKLIEVPEEYRAAAHCEIGSASGYEGSHYGHIEISYPRPETDEEMAAREAREAAQRAAREQ